MEKQIESMKQDVKNTNGAQKKKRIMKTLIAVIIIVLIGIHVWIFLGKAGIDIFPKNNNNPIPTNNPSQNIEAGKESEIDKKLDSDEDGIPDYLENIIGTDPQKADSDGDSYSDLKELQGGYDPMNIENPSKKLTEEEFNNLKEKIKAADEEFYEKEFGGSNTDTGIKSNSFICGTSTVADIDNNIYNTVKIGDQCWLKENLKVTKNPKGEAITRYCYDNDPKICETDGGLYDWSTTMDKSTTEGAQGICPSGWHVPKDSEWVALENGLKNEGKTCDANRSGSDCNSAETKLKQGGSSGFEGVLAGFRGTYGAFNYRRTYAYLWSSAESRANAWSHGFDSGSATVYRVAYDKVFGFSVRCLKD